nr:VCBS repeat-containing protein [Candidatus Neomarinimicrobiota bacterium]
MVPLITLNNKNMGICGYLVEQSRLLFLFFSLISIILPQYFIDITESSGTEVSRHQSSFFGAGVTIVDYDHDGLDDILVPTLQGQPFKVFKNLGDDTFLDYSESVGFENENAEAINILVADYDNDGFDDIYVVNFSASSALYRNNGDNTFEDVTLSSGIYS